jgi:hypothetical protein
MGACLSVPRERYEQTRPQLQLQLQFLILIVIPAESDVFLLAGWRAGGLAGCSFLFLRLRLPAPALSPHLTSPHLDSRLSSLQPPFDPLITSPSLALSLSLTLAPTPHAAAPRQ